MTNIRKIFCNTCKGETNHEIKSSHDKDYYEEYEDRGQKFLGYYEKTEYSFLICRGCDTATLEESWTCSGMHDHNGEDIYSSNYHPKRTLLSDREAKRFHHVNQILNETYKEIITSFQHDLSIVTSMGVRALLEGICVLEGIDDKTAWGLEKKIEKLEEVANIPEDIIEGLKGIKFVGDDAAHRLIPPEKHILSMAIDLLESLMTHMYEAKVDLENKAKILQQNHHKPLRGK